jgi:hypothetical protein
VCNLVETNDGGLIATPEEIERCRPRLEAMFRSAIEAADRLVVAHWEAIKRVAAFLLKRHELSRDEVAALVNGFQA